MPYRRATYGLVQSFGIDDGTMTAHPSEAFTLGVEWGIVFEKTRSAAPSSIYVHSENVERISEMLTEQGRRFSVGPASSGFATISIAGLD
jgi:hypothetical protein